MCIVGNLAPWGFQEEEKQCEGWRQMHGSWTISKCSGLPGGVKFSNSAPQSPVLSLV